GSSSLSSRECSRPSRSSGRGGSGGRAGTARSARTSCRGGTPGAGRPTGRARSAAAISTASVSELGGDRTSTQRRDLFRQCPQFLGRAALQAQDLHPAVRPHFVGGSAADRGPSLTAFPTVQESLDGLDVRLRRQVDTDGVAVVSLRRGGENAVALQVDAQV